MVFMASCSQVDQQDMSHWLETGVLIDTRTQEEFNAGHMPGAKLIPYDQIKFKIANIAPDKSTPILLYCRSGRRAGVAEKVLKDLGYENVKNVGGLAQIKAFVNEHGR
jgi:phage shock protein E